MKMGDDAKVVISGMLVLLVGVLAALGGILYSSTATKNENTIQQFDKTLKESLKECIDKYQLTMVLQERVEACEQGLTVMEEELDSCLNGSLYGTER